MEKTQRNTKQRQVVLEELQKLASHPTAVELYVTLREKLPKISLGTIYRNLELLTRNGVIQKLKGCGPEARFDGNPARHSHIRCVECGRVDDVHGISWRETEKNKAENLSGYEILDYRLEFTGICPECKKKKLLII